MSAPLLEARALGKSFGSTPVLREVNLSVEAGRGVAVIGANGAGKSTLIRLLAGLSAPSLGDAMLFGEPARTLAPALRRRVGLLSHQSFLYPNLTARENLQFYAALYGIWDEQKLTEERLTEKTAHQTVTDWLERVGLGFAAEARVRGFSRGMEQRLALARAMLAQPDVLMLDEPFAALDRDGAALAATLVREAMERGCAVLASAHFSEPLEELGFAVLALTRGKLMPSRPGAAREEAALAPLARQVS